MLLYSGITLWILILFLFGIRKNSANNPIYDFLDAIGLPVKRPKPHFLNALCFLTFLFLWFLTSFRSENIGNDTKAYIEYFDIFTNGIDLSRRFEIGYQYLCFFLGKLTSSHHVFLICVATIMYGGVICYVFKYSNNIPVSLCLFYCYFFSMFTQIFRQGIAMVIVLYGYQLLKERKKTSAAVLFALATTFHTTAIICFLLFFDLKILKKQWFVFSLTAFSVVLAGSGLLEKVVGIIAPGYLHYFEGKYASTGWLSVSYTLIIYLIWYLLISLSLLNNEEERIIVLNFTLMLIFAAFGFCMNLFTRAGEYFTLIAVVEIPNVLFKSRIKGYKIWLTALCVILLVMFIMTLVFRPGWNHLYPYELWK